MTNSGSLLLLLGRQLKLELEFELGRPKLLVLSIELGLQIVPSPLLLLVGLASLQAEGPIPKLVQVLRRWPEVPLLLGPMGRSQ